MRLQSMGTPDAAYAGLRNARLTRHPAAQPVRSSSGLRLRRARDHPGAPQR
jgi:hypothetical protein